MTVKALLAYVAVIAFALYGVAGIVDGDLRVGTASLALALANWLLLL